MNEPMNQNIFHIILTSLLYLPIMYELIGVKQFLQLNRLYKIMATLHITVSFQNLTIPRCFNFS